MSEVTATIKWGKGYEAPWFVGKGSVAEVREQIIAAFGMDAEFYAEHTLAELITQAATHAQGVQAAASSLGPVQILPKGDSAPAAPKVAEAPAGDPWEGVQASSPPWQGDGLGEGKDAPAAKEDKDPLIAALEAASDRAELALIWKQNQAEFSREEVKDAMKAAQGRLAK